MAADGSIIIDTRIDTSGVNKGSVDIKQQFDSMAQHAKTTAAEINDAVKAIDTKGTADGLSDSFDAENDKIQKILSDTERSAKSKAASIAAIYRKQGMSQQEAFRKAWAQIERSSSTGSKNVKDDIEGIGRKSKSVSNQMSGSISAGIAGFAKKIGALVATLFTVREIVQFGKECLKLGSDLQEVQNVVDVTFTAMNEQVNQFAKNAKNTAGLSETMAKQYVGTFGAMAKSFKFTEGEAYEMSTTLTQLSGDVASFYNLTQEQAYTKLKSVFTGETESLKDLGVVMTQAALDRFALEKGLGKTTNKMTEQEKVALRYQFVMEQLSGASGDFVRTSDSWANQTRLLTLQFDQLKATIGQGLINALTPVLQVVNQLIGRLQVLADQFLALTTELFGNAGGSSGSAIEDLAVGYNAAADGASNLAGATEEAGKAAKKYLAPFDEITKLGGKDSNTEAGSALGGIAPGGAPSTDGAVDGNALATPLIAALQAIRDKFKELIEPLKNIDFKPTMKSIKRLGKAFIVLGADIVKALEWAWFDILVPLGEWTIEEATPAALDLLSAAFVALGEALIPTTDGLEDLWEDLDPLVVFIEETVIMALASLRGMFDELANTISDRGEEIREIFSGIGEIFDIVWRGMKPILTAMRDKWRDTFDAISSYVVDRFGFIIDFLHGIVEFIAGVLTLDFGRAWEGLVEMIKVPLNSLIGYVNTMISAVVAGVNAIIDMVSVLSFDIPDWKIFGEYAGGTFGFGDFLEPVIPPQIPYLAKGDVLPPNKPFMAVVGDQTHGTNIEAPLSTIEEAVANVLGDMLPAMVAGFERVIEEQQATRRAVESIEVGDTTIGEAANRHNAKIAVITGGA